MLSLHGVEAIIEPGRPHGNRTIRRAEYGCRKKFYVETTINPKLREDHEKDGWIHVTDINSG
jgi:hypothetical protein